MKVAENNNWNEEAKKTSRNIFLEIVVTVFFALLFVFFLIKFLFF